MQQSHLKEFVQRKQIKIPTKMPNKRRAKLEMVKNKQQKNQAPQTLSR